MKIPCSNCNQKLEIPEELAGQTIECPACNTSLLVPASEAPPAGSSPTIRLSSPKDSPRPPRPKPTPGEGELSALKSYTDEITRHGSGSEKSLVFVRSLIGGAILVVLILIGQWIRNDPWENSTVKAHRKMVRIESAMVDKFNAAESVDVQVNAIRSAVGNLEKIDVDNLPQDYGDALLEMIKGLKGWSMALKRGDPEKADEYDNMRIGATMRLNEIMKAKGRY